MPTYQYVCTECDEGLEVQQTFSDSSMTICPTCEGRLRKVFNAVGVVFKGSGFYRTDSRAAAEASASNGSSSKSSDSTSSESTSSSESSKKSTDSSTPSTTSSSEKAAGSAA